MKLVNSSFTPALILALTSLTLVACSKVSLPSKDHIPFVYRIDVQQGNVITQEMLAQLELGMDKKKVEFIMGSPIITDTFHSNRWDYIYRHQKGHKLAEQRRVTLFFRDELLTKVEGNVVAANGEIITESRRMENVEVPPAEKRGLFAAVKEKLPLGDDDQPDLIKESAEDVLPDPALNAGDVPSAEGETEKVEAEIEAASSIEEEQEATEEESGFFGRMWDKLSGDDE